MKKPFDATGTIGSKLCEKSLNGILAETGDAKLIASIMRRYSHYRRGLKSLQDIQNLAFRKRMFLLWRNQYLTPIADIPEAVWTRYLCCVVACYREAMQEVEAAQ